MSNNDTSNGNDAPDLQTPLINEPEQASPAANIAALGPLQYLIGTWTNKNLIGRDGSATMQGGEAKPYGYCVMPLPQNNSVGGGVLEAYDSDGYILKNFTYYEELTFSPINGTAPNRNGSVTQVANTLFYEQRVYFADGPNKDALVHAENGSLLLLTQQEQQPGPYGDGDGDRVVNNPVPIKDNLTAQPYNLIKQMSVPHGNSIMSVGQIDPSNYVEQGSPTIADTQPNMLYPTGGLTKTDVIRKYATQDDVTNPVPAYTQNPNLPLQQAIDTQYPQGQSNQNRQPTKFIHLNFDAAKGKHPINNIEFEQQFVKVNGYCMDYWLEAFSNAGENDGFTQLQYSQTVLMKMQVQGHGEVNFPHILTNTLTKLS